MAFWALLTCGFVFLARDAEATERPRAAIKHRADAARLPEKDRPQAGRVARVAGILARFIDAMLDCAPCVAAWSAVVAELAIDGLSCLRSPWREVGTLVIGYPVAGVGLLYGMTLLSPTQAIARLIAARSVRGGERKDEETGKPGG